MTTVNNKVNKVLLALSLAFIAAMLISLYAAPRLALLSSEDLDLSGPWDYCIPKDQQGNLSFPFKTKAPASLLV